MKKTLAFLLVFGLLAALLSVPSVAATPTVTATASPAAVYAGGTVTVTVKVSNCTAKSLGLIPQYDTSAFELVTGSCKWLVTGFFTDNSPECATILFEGAKSFNGINVYQFQLKAKAGASLKNYTFSVQASAEGYTGVTATANITVACNHNVTSWQSVNNNQHSGVCTKCHATVTKNHSYSNACDTTCNDCGYVRTITHSFGAGYTADAEGHWHVCSVCGEKSTAEPHTPGPEATEDAPQVCTVCGYELAPAKSHVHVFEGEYLSDAAGHRKACKCGETGETEAHVWDAGTVTAVPAVGSAGIKVYRCTACGYEKQVELEYYPVEVTVPVENTQADTPAEERTSAPAEDAPKTGPVPQTEAPETEKSGCGAAVSAGALVTGLLPAAILMKKRKKEDGNT